MYERFRNLAQKGDGRVEFIGRFPADVCAGCFELRLDGGKRSAEFRRRIDGDEKSFQEGGVIFLFNARDAAAHKFERGLACPLLYAAATGGELKF